MTLGCAGANWLNHEGSGQSTSTGNYRVVGAEILFGWANINTDKPFGCKCFTIFTVSQNGTIGWFTRNGNFIHYRLANTNVFNAWKALRDLTVERIASIEKLVKDFRKSRFQLESVTIDGLIGKLDSRKVTLLNVRPATEFRRCPIANSISIPFDQLARRMKELPPPNEMIAYCRGPFCVLLMTRFLS